MSEPAMDDVCARCGNSWGRHFGTLCDPPGTTTVARRWLGDTDAELSRLRAELADLRARLARVVEAAREYRKRQRAGGACDAEITKRMAEQEWAAADALDAVLAEEVRRG